MKKLSSNRFRLSAAIFFVTAAWCALFYSVGNSQVAVMGEESMAFGGGSNPPASPLIDQNLEAVGYDNSESWTETTSGSATINEDDTANVLRETQSCLVSAGSWEWAFSTSPSLTPDEDDVWPFIIVEFTTARSGDAIPFMNVRTSGGSTQLELKRNTDGTITATCGTSSSTTVDTTSLGTPYYFWPKYQKGTGANAVYGVGFSTDVSTKPTSGNAYAGDTDGSSTGAIDFIEIGILNQKSGAAVLSWDTNIVDDEEILSNPF